MWAMSSNLHTQKVLINKHSLYANVLVQFEKLGCNPQWKNYNRSLKEPVSDYSWLIKNRDMFLKNECVNYFKM